MATTRKTYSLLKSSKYTLKKFAHTWSPLATVFNYKPANKLNLSILKEPKGLFDVPELTSSEGFYALKEKCEQETDNLINEAISPHRSRKMVFIFDELSNCLCKVADLAEFIRIAHPDHKYSNTAEIACSTVSSIVEKLNTNYDLYAALRNVVKNNDIMDTTDIDKHVAKLFLFDFEQCGIHLPEIERREVVNLNNSILHLGQHFVSGSCNPRLVDKDLLPASVLKLHRMEGNDIVMSGFHADSNDPNTREFAYRVFLFPEEHQEHLLDQLLDLRDQLAKMCGFKTYAERALRGSLAEDPETALRFLNLLADALHPRAAVDFKTMNQIRMIDCGKKSGVLNAWDIPYYTHKIRRNTFNVVGDEYSPYFSLGACMDGLNKLMQSLFGISFVNAEIAVGESWDPNIYKLAVSHETEGLLGYIYCDFFSRENKQNQDCHFTIQGGRQQSDGSYQLPVVVLMLNLPEPRWSSPSLLSPAMVDNLFHEMGHAMHSMLARTKYQHVTGTRCSTDFAEVPSVLMEYFANDPRVLSTFARHFQTGELMPEKMLTRLCASKHLFAASDMQMQVFYSILDQHYHGAHPLPGSTTDILAQIQGKHYGIPYVPNTAWQLRFSHLVGYGAKYYSYLMSKAVASWIWQTYFEKDPFSRVHGDLYRYQCLNFGGGKPPRKLVSDFLQREFSPEKLVESLVKETDEKMRLVEYFNLKKGY